MNELQEGQLIFLLNILNHCREDIEMLIEESGMSRFEVTSLEAIEEAEGLLNEELQ